MAKPRTSASNKLSTIKNTEKAKTKRAYKPEADKRFTMNMDAAIHQQLKEYCFVHNETMGDVIENLINVHLKRVKIKIVK